MLLLIYSNAEKFKFEDLNGLTYILRLNITCVGWLFLSIGKTIMSFSQELDDRDLFRLPLPNSELSFLPVQPLDPEK